MIIKYETEKGYGYLDGIESMVVYSEKYSDLDLNSDYVQKHVDKTTTVKKENEDNCRLYWAIKSICDVDFVDMNISNKHQTNILAKQEGTEFNITFIEYRKKSNINIKRVLVFIGNGWLISEEFGSVGKTIERIG